MISHITSHGIIRQGAREETAADDEKARREAQELYDAGEKRRGTDEAKFIEIIGQRSFPQLKATFEEYKKVRSKVTFKIAR